MLMTIEGRWSLVRVSRKTGEVLGEHAVGENTVLTAGKQDFLDLMFGLGGTIYSTANTKLKLYTAADALIKTLDCKTGYPLHGADNSGTVQWWFEDISLDIYTADRLDFLNSSSTVVFSQKDPSGLAQKPNSENWIYKYTLTITQNGDSDLKMDGLDRALRIMTGDQAGAFSSPEILIENNGATVTSTHGADGAPSRTAEMVTLVFTATTAQNNQEWFNVAVRDTLPDAGATEISRTQENLGTKISSDQWVYTFTFSL